MLSVAGALMVPAALPHVESLPGTEEETEAAEPRTGAGARILARLPAV